MAWQLLKGSTDIIAQVPIESIEVTEAGPGGVSSIRFTADDPTKALAFTKRESIRLVDAGGVDHFRGFAEQVTMRPVGIGREIDVEATGVEAVLDWLLGNAAGTIAAGTNYQNAINQIITNKLSALNAGMSTARNGDATNPIGDFVRPALGTAPFLTGGVNWVVPVNPPGTLRQQIEELNRKSAYNAGAGVYQPFNTLLTIDFELGVRAWEDDITLQPDDYTTLTVLDTPAGTYVASSLKVTKDWGSVPDRVWVEGTGISGFRPTAGGPAIPRREALLTDSEITTANERDMAGDAFIIAHGVEDRGEFDLEDWAPPVTVHAGSLLDLTDANTGVAAVYRIMEIRKKFYGSFRQDWHVTYGRLAPSAIRQIGAVVVRR